MRSWNPIRSGGTRYGRYVTLTGINDAGYRCGLTYWLKTRKITPVATASPKAQGAMTRAEQAECTERLIFAAAGVELVSSERGT